jgi:hypothetical protein
MKEKEAPRNSAPKEKSKQETTSETVGPKTKSSFQLFVFVKTES